MTRLNPFDFRASYKLEFESRIWNLILSLNPFDFRASYKHPPKRRRQTKLTVSIPLISGLHTNLKQQCGQKWFYASQSLWFQGFIQTRRRQLEPNCRKVSIPLISGLHTNDGRGRISGANRVSIPLISGLHTNLATGWVLRGLVIVSIPLISGLHTNKGKSWNTKRQLSLNPFDFRASYKLYYLYNKKRKRGLNPFDFRASYKPDEDFATCEAAVSLNPFDFRASYKLTKACDAKEPPSQSLWFQGFIQTKWRDRYSDVKVVSQSLWFQGFIQTERGVHHAERDGWSQSLWFQGFIQTRWVM